MERTSTVFDRLRALETQGQSLHALIGDACDVGDELLRLVQRYRRETPLGHQPHMIAHQADAAIARAFNGDSHTPDNGKAAA
jgi:hypothetical protein